MKRLVVLAACAVLLPGLAGCQNSVSEAVAQNKAVEVTVEGGSQFPESLAGKWECENEGLAVVFEPNGAIASAVMPFGKPHLSPGGRVDFNNVDIGTKGYFEAGPFTADYVPATRELKVELSLSHYHISTEAGEILDGSSTDIFIGKVSEDGKTWRADWFAIPEYHLTSELYKNFKVPTDPNDVFEPQATFVFRKVRSP